MALDKFVRIGLTSSLAANAVAICFLGYAQTFKTTPATVAQPKALPPLTRLVEIQRPPQDHKVTSKGGKTLENTEEDHGRGDSSERLSDAKVGPEGKLSRGKLATIEKPKDMDLPPVPPKVKPMLPRPARVAKSSERKKKSSELSRNIKVAIRVNKTIDLKLVRLKRPGPLKTGGYHGIVDLRKMKLTAHLLAMLDKANAKVLPNKLVGKQHVQIIGKIGGKSVCIATGGHTIYGSDLKVYLGHDIKLYGTKFCIPGGISGSVGNASQTDPRQPVTSISQSSGSQGGGYMGQSEGKETGGGKDAQSAGSLEGYRPLHESGGPQTIERGPSPGQAGYGEPEQRVTGGEFIGKGDQSTPTSHDASDVGDSAEAAQRSLQERYLKYASGSLRGVPESQSTARPLHLPQSGPVLNKEIPGVDVPKDQRKLVDDPKEHRGSSGAKESVDLPTPKPAKFLLTPTSVGSLSTNGDVVWAMAAGKTHKSKATRKVKGHGKSDGGGDGTGLLGVYFRGDDLRQEVFRRPDRVIDFDWTFRPVDTRMPVSTYFSVRWTGEIRANYSEPYTIYCASDDGSRVWIDGRLVISNWTDHSATEDVAVVNFAAGHKYSIKVEYYANSITPSVVKLYWQSAHQVKEYVPQSCLFYPHSR